MKQCPEKYVQRDLNVSFKMHLARAGTDASSVFLNRRILRCVFSEISNVSEYLEAFLEATWSVLEGVPSHSEALGSVLFVCLHFWKPLGGFLEVSCSLWEPLGALLKAIWPETENVENPMVFLALWSLGRSWRRLGGVLERLGGVSEASWRVLEVSWRRLGGVLKRLGAVTNCVVASSTVE